MRGIRQSLLFALPALAVAVGVFWMLPVQTPTPDTGRLPSSETSRPSGEQAARRQSPGPDRPAREARPGDTARRTDDAAGSAAARSNLVVWGTIETEYGGVAPGETVELYSASLQRRSEAVSNAQGEVVFDNMPAASDYQVTVTPEGAYENYRRRGLRIDADHPSFTVVLQALRTGVLRGDIVNPEGQPVPNFVIWVRSRAKDRGILRTRSDSVGLFRIEDFPEGPFEVFSREVLLRITGLYFEADANDMVTLVVDHGPHQLSGRVFDRHGQPVFGAVVVLTWRRNSGDVQSTVENRTLTDTNGAFTFDGLAYGEHELMVSLTGAAAIERKVVVGETPADMVLYLEQ